MKTKITNGKFYGLLPVFPRLSATTCCKLGNVKFFCNKIFNHFSIFFLLIFRSNVNRHFDAVHTKKMITNCEICQMAFKCRTNKNRHVLRVHNGVTYKCKKCEKTYHTEVKYLGFFHVVINNLLIVIKVITYKSCGQLSLCCPHLCSWYVIR